MGARSQEVTAIVQRVSRSGCLTKKAILPLIKMILEACDKVDASGEPGTIEAPNPDNSKCFSELTYSSSRLVYAKLYLFGQVEAACRVFSESILP